MKKLAVVLCGAVALILLVWGALIVRSLYFSDPVLEEARVVLPYLDKAAAQGKPLEFHAGPYRTGTAVLGPNDAAFWVKDGTGYVVNEAARFVAPDLKQAPDNVQFDATFIEAAHAGE
jgi:hypothetical protein